MLSAADRLEEELRGRAERNGAHARAEASGAEGANVFALANGVWTPDLLGRLGITIEMRGEKPFATCPGCGKGDALVCKDGGMKCFHAVCANVGPQGMPGFRTNIDVVAHIRQDSPIEAAKLICQWFEIKVPKPTNSKRESTKEPAQNPFEGRFRWLAETR